MSQTLWSRLLALGVALLLGSYLLLTSTVNLQVNLWTYDVKRFLELCLLPLIFATVLFNGGLRTAFFTQLQRIPRWVLVVLSLILALGISSSVHNSNSAMSLTYSLADVSLLTLLTLAVLCIAACRQVAGPVFDQATILLIALLAVAVGLQELLGVLAARNSGLEFQPVIALLHFSYPRFYNQVQSWSIPVIAALPLVFPGRPLAKLLCFVALALEWYVVLATGGRGSMAAVGLAILIAVVLLPAIRKTLLQYQLAGLFGGVLIYALVVVGQQGLQQGNDAASALPENPIAEQARSGNALGNSPANQAAKVNNGQFLEPLIGERVWTSSGRIALWRESLLDAQAHPLIGIGPMNYACTGPINRAAHPHNFLFQFLSEWGIPATLLLLLVIAFLLFELLQKLRKPLTADESITPLAGFLASGMLAALIHACLSGVLVMPASQVTGVLVSACLLGLIQTRVPARSSNRAGVTVLIAGLALSLAFLVFARHEIGVAETRWEQTPPMDKGIPRLWQNGKVCRLYLGNEGSTGQK